MRSNRTTHIYSILVGLFVSIFFAIFTLVSLHRFWQYSSWYYDFGIFYRAISAVSQGQPPVIDHFVLEGTNILGDHFHPIIFMISPLLAIIPRPEVLLIVQSLFVALSGIFIYATARHLLHNRPQAIAILTIYFSFVGLHNALITEFHEITLLPLPLSVFLYALTTKKFTWYFVSLVAVLLTKETTFIIPAFFGVYLAFLRNGKWRRVGVITTIVSLIYGWVILNYVMPFFAGQPYRYIAEASQEFNWLKLVEPLKLRTVFRTFLSFGFLPLLAPEILPPVIINWFTRFAGPGTRADLGMHYNAEISPTLAFATMIGFKRVRDWLPKIPFIPHPSKHQYSVYATTAIALIAAGTVGVSVLVLNTPALLAFNPDFYKHTRNFTFLNELLNHVPSEGIVMAQHNLAGKLADQPVLILRDNYDKYAPDYIVIDTRAGQEPNNFLGIKDFEQLVKTIKNDPNYSIYYDQGEQFIFKRNSPAVP